MAPTLPAKLRHLLPALASVLVGVALLGQAMTPSVQALPLTTAQSTCTGSPTTSIATNFNGTAIPGNSTIWFSSVFNLPGTNINSPTTINVNNATITFTSGGTTYNVAVPDSTITLQPGATSATTSFSAGQWSTVAPPNTSGNDFMAGVALPVPAGGFPGGIQNVTWTATVSSSIPGLKINWL